MGDYITTRSDHSSSNSQPPKQSPNKTSRAPSYPTSTPPFVQESIHTQRTSTIQPPQSQVQFFSQSHPRTRSWLPTSHMISLRKSSRNSSLLMSHPPPRSPSAQSPASWSRSFKPATNPP